jgi:hypothetical protein
MFVDGEPVELIFQTDLGPVLLTALVAVEGSSLRLLDLWFYPATSSSLPVGVRAILEIFRELAAQAKVEGFTTITVEACRLKPRAGKRMLTMTRNLW